MNVTLHKTFSDFCNLLVSAILREVRLELCYLNEELAIDREFVIIHLFN